jgi:dynein light chain roadblock-type
MIFRNARAKRGRDAGTTGRLNLPYRHCGASSVAHCTSTKEQAAVHCTHYGAELCTFFIYSARYLLTSCQTDETLSLLTRLSQKPGVQSTLILSRETGAIVRTSGLISNTSSASPNSTLPASNEASGENYTNSRKESGIHSAEDVASLVWSFLKAAGSLVDELDKEDEVKLLRLRTKKNELVIVPGMQYHAPWL